MKIVKLKIKHEKQRQNVYLKQKYQSHGEARNLFPVTDLKISKKYYIKVTLSGIFFAVWGIIYLAFFSSPIYACIYDLWKPSTWISFAIWNLSGSTWMRLFDTGTRTKVLLSIPLLFVMLASNFYLWESMAQNPKLNSSIYMWVINGVGLGMEWLVTASNLGIGIVMVHYLRLTINNRWLRSGSQLRLATQCYIGTA